MVDFVSSPLVGDEKVINNKLFRWDGEKWAAVKEVRPKQVTSLTTMLSSTKPYIAGSYIEVHGYSTPSDRGKAYWQRINESDTPSQTPSQLVDAKFTDALGQVWEYVDTNGYLNLNSIGAVGDDSTDNDLVFAAANSSRFKYYKLFSGIYQATSFVLKEGSCLEGVAGDRPEIKLKDNGNNTLLYGENVKNVTIRDLVVDGNRVNQSIGSSNNHRGIYFLGVCSNLDIENVTVKNCVDHGIFFSNGGVPSNECGKDSTVRNVIVTNCGSEAHILAGGAGGTGIVGGQRSTHFVSCVAYSNYLNGFKSNGTHTGCESYSNTGGGYETGFGSPSTVQAKWVQCSAENNGGTGWRNQGEGDELTWVGCLAKGNGGSGILLLNSVDKALISDSWFINNGQNSAVGTRSDTEGFDGITFTGTSSNPNGVTVSNCQFKDDQTTKTQETHIYFRKDSPNVVISDNNQFGDAKIQPIFFESATYGSNILVGSCVGLSTTVNDSTDSIVTGTVSTTNLTSHTIDSRSFINSMNLRLTAVGVASGVVGTKLVEFGVDGTYVTISSQTAGQQNSYILQAKLYRQGSNIYVDWECKTSGGTSLSGTFSVVSSPSNTLNITTRGTLGSVSDSITEKRFILESF
jgi:hypothetical protein